MRKVFFRALAAINKAVLPSMRNRDLNRLGKLDKILIAWRYWVTTNALD